MADIEVGDLVARISFDDTGLNKSMAEINRQMKLVESEFDKASSAVAGYGSEEEQLRAKTASLTQQVQLQQQKVNNLNAAFQKSITEKGADAVATQKLATQLNKAQADSNRLENELRATSKELAAQKSKVSALGKAWDESMQQAHASVGTLSDGFKRAGAGVTAAGAGIAAGLGLAISKAADFEQEIANVKSVMDPEDVQKFGAELSKLAIKMGADTKYSATEAAQGIEELVKAGVSADAIMSGGLAGALDLATAGQLNLADAAEIASTALNAFKADGIDVTRAADLLAGAANASATDVGELKFALAAVSAVASGVGLSFEDTATALAVFAQNGLKGSDAGTSLKTMLLNLQPHTDAAYNKMSDLGLMVVNTQKAMGFLAKKGIKPVADSADGVIASLAGYLAQLDGAKTVSAKYFKDAKKMADANGLIQSAFYDANGSIKDMDDIAGLLHNSMAGLTDAERQMALQTIFGTDAIRAGNILFKEGAKGLEDMNAAMNNVTAADVAAQRMDTLKGSIEQLRGSVETAQISIGTALMPAVRGLSDVLDGVVDRFNRLSPAMQSNVAIGAAITAAFLLIAGPLLMLIGFLPQIIVGFELFGPVLAALTGPIGLIIAAVAALVAGIVILYNKNDDFRKFVDKTWSAIQNTIVQAARTISALVGPLIADMVEFLKGQLDDLKAFWKENGQAILTALKVIFDGIVDTVKMNFGIIKGLFEAVWPIISNIVKINLGVIKLAISTALDLIMGIVQFWIKIFQGDWKGAWETVQQTFLNIWGNIQAFLKSIDLAQIGKEIINGLIKGIGSMADAVVDRVKKIADLIPSGLKKVLDIHSPSRVTEQIGIYAGQGLANGLSKSQKQVEAAAKKQAAAAAKAIKDNFNAAMSSAQYKFKMGEIDTEGYVAALNTVKAEYAKTGDQVQKVNLAIKAANDKLTKDLAAAAKAQFDTSKTYIESKKQANELSLQQELAAWQRVQARYAQGSKERLAADKEVNRIKQQMDKDSFDKSEQYIQQHQMSLMDELSAWERVQARYKAGTAEREQAEKEVARVRKEIYDQLTAANEEFLRSTKAINDNVIAEEKRLNDEYAAAVDQRAGSIASFAGLFDQVTQEAKSSGAELLANLQGQVAAMAQWQANLAALAARGINGGLLKELQEMGPKAAPELAALNTLTDEQLQQYAGLWQTKQNLARTEAVTELEGLRTDTISKIAQLKIDAASQLDEVKKVFEDKVKAIRTGATGQFNAMKADMPTIGKQAMQGLLDGLNSMTGPLTAKAQEIANTISGTIRKALQIKSPSRVMMEIGQFTGAGLAEGMQSSLGGITRQAANMAAAAVPALQGGAIPAARSAASAGGSAGAQSSGVTLADLDGLVIKAPVYLDGKKVAEAVSSPLGSLIQQRRRGLGFG